MHEATRMSGEMLLVETLIKRSQQKKRTSPLNYKERLFVLTKTRLTYYDGRAEVLLLFFFSLDYYYQCHIRHVEIFFMCLHELFFLKGQCNIFGYMLI